MLEDNFHFDFSLLSKERLTTVDDLPPVSFWDLAVSVPVKNIGLTVSNKIDICKKNTKNYR